MFLILFFVPQRSLLFYWLWYPKTSSCSSYFLPQILLGCWKHNCQEMRWCWCRRWLSINFDSWIPLSCLRSWQFLGNAFTKWYELCTTEFWLLFYAGNWYQYFELNFALLDLSFKEDYFVHCYFLLYKKDVDLLWCSYYWSCECLLNECCVINYHLSQKFEL